MLASVAVAEDVVSLVPLVPAVERPASCTEGVAVVS